MIPQQKFNIDELGVSSLTEGLGKGKAEMRANCPSNTVELEFAGNAEHLKVMPVVLADEKLRKLVVILPETLSKFSIREDGKKETFTD